MTRAVVLSVPEGNGLQRQGEDGLMLATRSRQRVLEVIPALLVMMLSDLGKLPEIPNLPKPTTCGFRKPELADMESLRWLACWGGARTDRDGFRRVAGLASFRDVYDWHLSSDVRELVAIRGSKRACVELTRWLVADGMAHGRRLVGAVKKDDSGLIHLMERLGGHITRRFMEYACPA